MSEDEREEFQQAFGTLRQVSPMSVNHTARITSTARGLLRAAIVFGTTPDAR